MQEVPISIQRAMIRRNALVSVCSIVMLIGLAGYLPWSLLISIAAYMAMLYIHVLSAAAKRLRALKKSNKIQATYANSVERLVNNTLLFVLLVFAVVLFALHMLAPFSAGLLLASFYPGLMALAAVVTVYFYFAQLPKVVSSRPAQTIFGSLKRPRKRGRDYQEDKTE